VLKQTRQNYSEFNWTEIRSVEELGRQRMAAMQRFLNDYDAGRNCGRYLVAELPSLPFEDQEFDLALCSHFLFLYSDHFSREFHEASIVELCRVAKEVRILPVIGLGGVPSRHVEPVTDTLQRRGLSVKIETVDYEFQRGANQMMRILR
jgi:ubiquinone/menaquinone biosynthesis C-methylase UbiE